MMRGEPIWPSLWYLLRNSIDFQFNLFKIEMRKRLNLYNLQKDRDASGAAVALFTARFHNPLTSARNVTLQSLVHQLDAALDR